MTSLRLRLLQGGVALAALLATAIASADQGTIVLVTGQVIVGEVQQVQAGEYILVQLPSGEVKAVAWAQIGSFTIGGSATVSTGNAPTPAPAPAPAPAPEPYTPPPPPPPPPPAPTFTPSWMLGVRLGSATPTGNIIDEGPLGSRTEIGHYAKSGWAFEANLGMHLSPAWTLYGLWEHGQYGRGEANNATGTDNSKSNMLGGGLNINTSPRAPVGFLIDTALAYRWFTFGYPTTTADSLGNPVAFDSKVTASGAAFRLGGGLAINATKKFRVDLLGYVTFTTFRDFKGSGLENSHPGNNVTYGLTVGGRWDL